MNSFCLSEVLGNELKALRPDAKQAFYQRNTPLFLLFMFLPFFCLLFFGCFLFVCLVGFLRQGFSVTG